MKKILKLCILILTVFFFGNIENVFAEQIQKSICISDIKYTITWDSVKNPMVSIDKIDATALSEWHVAYPSEDLPELEKQKYSFTWEAVGSRCETTSDGQVISCPSASAVNVNIADVVLVEETSEMVVVGLDENGEEIKEPKTKFKNIDMTYVVSQGKVLVKVEDIFNNQVRVRNVTGKSASEKNSDGTKLATDYADSEFLNRTRIGDEYYYVLGYYNASNESNQVKIELEFYLTSAPTKCTSMYIGNISFTTPYDSEIEIDNPAITNKTEYGCSRLYKEGSNELLDIIPDDFDITTSVPECFSSKIKLYELSTLKNTIKTKLDSLLEIFESLNVDDNSGSDVVDDTPEKSTIGKTDFICEYDSNGNIKTQKYTAKNVLSSSGSYWSLSCKEEYDITPTQPKIVRAGAGFSYLTTVVAKRTCYISYSGKVVTMKPQCRKVCHHECYLPDGSNPWGDPDRGGPNEEFDSCIYNCDGGNYTQDCINSCYNKVYGDIGNRDLSFTKKTKSLIDDIETGNLEKTAAKGRTDNDDCNGEYCTDGCGDSYKYSNWCEGHGTICTEYEEIVPGGCSWDPQADYDSEISAIRSELSKMKALAESYTNVNDGSYTVYVMDSYLKSTDGAYTYTFKSEDWNGPKLVVNSETFGSSSDSRSPTIGENGETANYDKETVRGKTIKVSLPKSYLSKINGDAYYLGKTDKLYTADTSKPIDLDKGSYKKPLTFDSSTRNQYYRLGNNYYYTNLYSSNYNVNVGEDKVTFIDNPQISIGVKIKDAGTNGKLDKKYGCYHGVYNDTFCKDKDECPSDDDGIQFIFRPIDLDDVFPNEETSSRTPRWNWTNNASILNSDSNPNKELYSLLNYKVQPEKLTSDIQEYGYNVYNDSNELDYEIILTPENIKNIRTYNKEIEDINKDGSANYLDYDMTCGTKNNREVCYSKFLDNTNYITYGNGFNSSTRKDIAICNNVRGKQCTN